MPTILVPGVAEVAMKGTIGPHPWAVIFHFKKNLVGQNWSISDLNALCQGLFAGAQSQIAVHTCTDVTFQECLGVDLGLSNPATGISSGAAFAGSGTGPTPPPSTCVLVTYQITSRYRGGHPRAYMPPGPTTQMDTNEDAWLSTFVATYSTAFGNMMDAAFAASPGCIQVAPRYNYTYIDDPVHHKWIKQRSSHKEDAQVFNWIAKAALATQRRRLHN
jgi:hypothetical protein